MPASEVPLERAAKTQPFPLVTPPLSRMSMAAGDVATVTPEIEAGCREAAGGRAARRTVPAARLQSAARAVPRQPRRRQLGRHVVLARARLPVRQHQRARADVRPDARPEGATGPAAAKGQGNRVDPGGPVRRRRRRRALQHPQRQRSPAAALPAAAVGPAHRRGHEDRALRLARAARRHPQPAAGATEDGAPRQRRDDRHARRGGLRRRDRRRAVPRLRRAHRQGAVDVHAAGRGAGDADHLSRRGRPAVRRHHVDGRRLLRQSGDRRQRHGVRAAAARGRAATGSAAAPARRPANP